MEIFAHPVLLRFTELIINPLPILAHKQLILKKETMKTYMVTYEVQFEDGVKPHMIFARNCKNEHDAELKVKHYWILDRNLPIGRCLKVELHAS